MSYSHDIAILATIVSTEFNGQSASVMSCNTLSPQSSREALLRKRAGAGVVHPPIRRIPAAPISAGGTCIAKRNIGGQEDLGPQMKWVSRPPEAS